MSHKILTATIKLFQQEVNNIVETKRKMSENLKKLIKNFCRDEENILAAYVFGSYGTRYQSEESDLDLAVLFKESPSIMKQMELAGKLEIKLGEVEIDLINLNSSNLILQHEVLLKGTRIFCRDKIKTADFIEYVLKFAPDARIFQKKFQNDYILGLKEELK